MVTIARLECDFIRYGWSFKPLISVCYLGEPLPKLMDRSRKDGLSLTKGHHPQTRHLGTVPVCHRQVDGRSDLPDARPGLFAYLAGVCTASIAGIIVSQLLPA